MFKQLSDDYDRLMRQGKSMEYIKDFIFEDCSKQFTKLFFTLKSKNTPAAKMATEAFKTRPSYEMVVKKAQKFVKERCSVNVAGKKINGELIIHYGYEMSSSLIVIL